MIVVVACWSVACDEELAFDDNEGGIDRVSIFNLSSTRTYSWSGFQIGPAVLLPLVGDTIPPVMGVVGIVLVKEGARGLRLDWEEAADVEEGPDETDMEASEFSRNLPLSRLLTTGSSLVSFGPILSSSKVSFVTSI